MEDQEDYLDLEFDDDCYNTSWDMLNMWYRRAQRLLKLREAEENEK